MDSPGGCGGWRRCRRSNGRVGRRASLAKMHQRIDQFALLHARHILDAVAITETFQINHQQCGQLFVGVIVQRRFFFVRSSLPKMTIKKMKFPSLQQRRDTSANSAAVVARTVTLLFSGKAGGAFFDATASCCTETLSSCMACSRCARASSTSSSVASCVEFRRLTHRADKKTTIIKFQQYF